ncbi:hypothetical protein SNOG_02468 [Parastagonospora nodorum SN15]|uniref:Uncharacterized protein n=1 Tax=Phaeosphaeria nodorum (strain SN15 / ATCC MYA-4574 / FGSC 10173) TaxID=321614 RepID=Q0V0J6_PHANO|nr:hypothetical protein SNOG_02468 [Parastagonospora nodorum SN15]EAT90680.1 hypothetical protein SNOG_02468 [Parastagonospora nodorum SN15]
MAFTQLPAMHCWLGAIDMRANADAISSAAEIHGLTAVAKYCGPGGASLKRSIIESAPLPHSSTPD